MEIPQWMFNVRGFAGDVHFILRMGEYHTSGGGLLPALVAAAVNRA
jgi:hypothetical protein